MQKIMVWFAAVAAAVVAVGAEERIAGTFESKTVYVPVETSVAQDKAIVVKKTATFDKTGEGTLVLPVGNLKETSDAPIGVRSGTIELAAGGTAEISKPTTALLNRAAMWFDASCADSLSVSNSADGTKFVTEWRDVRETKSEEPYDHLRAEPRYCTTDVAWAVPYAPPQIRADSRGTNVLYFGRYRSGRWMAFVDPKSASTAAPFKLEGILHVFVVNRIVDNYWFLMGMSTAGGKQCWHPQNSACGIGIPYGATNYKDAPTITGMRMYLNGKLEDPCLKTIQKGTFLYESDFRGYPGFADSFANCSSLCKPSNDSRQGGDDLCEVLVFTNRLTEAERVQVENYLMDKWAIVKPSSELAFSVAKDAMLRTSDAMPSALKIRGRGTFVNAGNVETILEDVGDSDDPLPTVEVEAGSVVVKDGMPFAVAGAATVTAARALRGDTLSVSDSGIESGTLTKLGEGRLRVERIPETVSCVAVNGGTLVLGGVDLRDVIVGGTNEVGMLTDGSFETYTGRNEAWGKESPLTNCGWTYCRDPGRTEDFYAGIWNQTKGVLWASTYAGLDGSCFMVLRGSSYAQTDVILPEDGVYELSFAMTLRNNSGSYMRAAADVLVGPDDEHLSPVCRTWPQMSTLFRYQAHVLPFMTAGVYRVKFHSISKEKADCPFFDDVKVRLVSRTDRAWPVPNGDFETVVYRGVAGDLSTLLDQNDTPEGWTISPKSENCAVVDSARTNGDEYTYYLQPGSRTGTKQLFLRGMSCTASTTFVSPGPGRFRLRADFGVFKINDYLEVPKVHAYVKVGDGPATCLGQCGSDVGTMMATRTWATPFDVTADATVLTLTLSNGVAASTALIDNLALVPVGADDLIVNGGFETADAWTFHDGPNCTPEYGDFADRLAYAYNPNDLGYARYAGNYRLRLWNTCAATQSVTFPSAGRYRLRFHSAQRVDSRRDDPDAKGLAPFRAWYVANGVTNVIGELTASTSNYVAHAWEFAVPAAAAGMQCAFGFEGLEQNSKVGGRDCTAYIDGVSLKKIDETERAECPELPENLELSVAPGAKLRLDYRGTNVIGRLRLGGRFASGFVSAKTHPEFVFGSGTLYIKPLGMMIIAR